jgi:REP element-mobilizing transposase RayT
MKDRPRKTRQTWNEPGHAHYLTYSCYRRLPLLSRNRVRRWVVDGLQRTREELAVALWAYVIMPEHVHVLLHPRAAHYEMRRILAVLKQPVAKAARHWLEQHQHGAWLERLTVVYPSRRVPKILAAGRRFRPQCISGKDGVGDRGLHPCEPGSARARGSSGGLGMVERAILGGMVQCAAADG